MLSAKKFQARLLNWFDKHGRKHLPWQQNKTPYRVWVSEIMLQQTQVQTVIPYFERFMANFPDIFALAQASQDEVLAHWAGLGYYSRARHLHRAAQLIVENYRGIFPDTEETLQQLPGIGSSTAGAILAIAFKKPATILDGNVKRVLARIHAITTPINDKKTENHLWELAKHYTPLERSDDYTQAIMDLGATLCTRTRPQCEHCPFTKYCLANKQNLTTTLPIKKATRALPTRQATFFIIRQANKILLQKRAAPGIWGGLWCLPEMSGKPLKTAMRAFCEKEWQRDIKHYQQLKPFKHTFSHYHLMIHPVIVEMNNKIKLQSKTHLWYDLLQPQLIGLPKPIQSILQSHSHSIESK